jgi:hypothetical protein
MTSDRGTGTTTRQIEAAPPNAIFVWCNRRLEYPRSLAGSIGRNDLRIVSLAEAEYGECLRGVGRFVVVDHEAEHRLSPRALALIQHLNKPLSADAPSATTPTKP